VAYRFYMERKHPNLIKIGKKIRELRKSKKISQEELAAQAELGRAYCGRIERGEQNLSIQTLLRIAITLKVEPAKLLPSLRELKKPQPSKNSNH
jgi:transcriptional regulator with XRE-family HTH domain